MEDEIWKTIPRFNNEYEVSNTSKIRSVCAIIIRANGWKYTRISKVLKPSFKGTGYFRGAVIVNKKMISYQLHRIIAEAFIPNPESKPQVNHINGIKTDNRIENLEWCTISENQLHAYKLGLHKPKRGEDNINSKLTEQDVKEIRSYVLFKKEQGIKRYGRDDLAKKYGVSSNYIKDIVSKRRGVWSHI